MSSIVTVTASSKSFGQNGVPEQTDVVVRSTIKKKISDTTFFLSLSDATFKDQGKYLKDVVVAAERKLGGAWGDEVYRV
jgi:hypothetical protein